MNLAQGCTTCKSPAQCDCKAVLLKYISILQRADQRVSTPKPTSANETTRPLAAHIDKLTFELASPIHQQELQQRFKAAGLKSQLIKLRDRRWYLQVGGPDSGIYCSLRGMNAPLIHQIVTRPSAYSNYAAYMKQIGQILQPEETALLKVTRLDLALDYPVELQTILTGLDYENKQNRTNFQDKGGRRTGLNIGAGAEKIVIYDKALQQKQSSPLTRIEIQLSSKKLPSRSLNGIEEALLKTNWNPFTAITLNHVTFAHQCESLPKPQQDRLQKLKTITEHEGLFSARRTLNIQGNFTRDYGALLTVQPWSEQPAEAFKKQITSFFNPIQKEDHYGNNREAKTSKS